MLRVILLIGAIASPALSYSTGAPKDVCGTMAPQHGPTISQTSSAPYFLQAPQSVKAGQKMTVTLRSQSQDDVIKGFVIQALVGGQSVGTFVPQGNSQTLDCNGSKNALTHTKILTNLNEIKFDWIAPSSAAKQTVQFVATVVKRGDLYWVKGVKTNVQIL